MKKTRWNSIALALLVFSILGGCNQASEMMPAVGGPSEADIRAELKSRPYMEEVTYPDFSMWIPVYEYRVPRGQEESLLFELDLAAFGVSRADVQGTVEVVYFLGQTEFPTALSISEHFDQTPPGRTVAEFVLDDEGAVRIPLQYVGPWGGWADLQIHFPEKEFGFTAFAVIRGEFSQEATAGRQ